MSHTSPDEFTEKTNDKINTKNDDKYKEETSNIQEGNESLDNSETSNTLRDDSIVKTTKEIETFIQRFRTMNFKYHVIHSVIYIVSLCGKKIIELAKEIIIIPEKDKWEIPTVIPLMPIVGVNHRLTILHMSKIMVYIYSTENNIHQFSIGYMINPSFNINKISKT